MKWVETIGAKSVKPLWGTIATFWSTRPWFIGYDIGNTEMPAVCTGWVT